jgi:hypothetical protein
VSEHTPGPWTYGVRRNKSIWLSLGDHRIDGAAHYQGDLVATPADAKLICAAPDLLRELRAVEWAGEDHDRDDCWPCCPSCRVPAPHAEAIAREYWSRGQHQADCTLAAAIAKAVGR